MKVTAWNCGTQRSDGNGYGLKVSVSDRETYFKTEWKSVFLELEGEQSVVEININKASFWNKTCRELINKEIGQWLIKNKLAPWKKGFPPKLALHLVGERSFRLLIQFDVISN